MMPSNPYIPIIGAAAVHMLVGMVWFSEYLFGPMWKKLCGKCDHKDFAQKMGFQAVASLITATALWIAIAVFQKSQAGAYTQEGFGRIFSLFLQGGAHNVTVMSAMQTASFIWMGFVASISASWPIWTGDRKTWHMFMLTTGHDLAGLLAMAAALASLG